MDTRAEHLATLGLAPTASWDEVTQAYKDLMRVWHPDRFQGDERLRKKAEAQAQRINNAMSELRKMGKEAPSSARGEPREQHKQSNSTRGTTSTSQADSARHHQHHQTASNEQTSSSGTRSFMIAPLYIRQRFATSLFRVAAACAVFYVTYESIRIAHASPYQEAASLAFAFMALDFGVRNLTVMLLPKPIAAIERNGLFFLKTGKLSWADIESAWPVMTPRSNQISLVLSQHYIGKQNFFLRVLLRFRRWAKSPHIVIPFNGLTVDPVSAINAMRLRQIHQDVAIEEPLRPPTGLILLALVVCAACFAVAITRCALNLSTSHLEYIAYFALFGLSRCASVVLRVFKC
jgi:hypothetical protein